MLWILDASINVSMEPFRALVADMLPSAQRTQGFAIQTFFIGLGAVVASILPYVLINWFDVSNTAAAGEIPDSVKWSFYLGGSVFFAAVLWSVLRTREYPPDEFRRYNGEEGTDLVDAGLKQIWIDFTQHAQDDDATGGGAIFYLAGAVLRLDLHHFGRHRAHVRYH